MNKFKILQGIIVKHVSVFNENWITNETRSQANKQLGTFFNKYSQ